jgi:hypothetical protein
MSPLPTMTYVIAGVGEVAATLKATELQIEEKRWTQEIQTNLVAQHGPTINQMNNRLKEVLAAIKKKDAPVHMVWHHGKWGSILH